MAKYSRGVIEDLLSPGTPFRYASYIAKVMAVKDGWVMARIPRCTPFTISVNDVIPMLQRTGGGR